MSNSVDMSLNELETNSSMKIEDPVIGKFHVNGEFALIIKHPLFIRLRDIKQLGLLGCILPVVHYLTRYDHCLGTYYRAREMLKYLKHNTKLAQETIEYIEYEDLPKLYKKCVLVAALLHDIGHGPFSHTWEYIMKDYHHEWNALGCIDKIMYDYKEFAEFAIYWQNDGHGIDVIKSLIIGEPSFPKTQVPLKFMYIYEIVNNRKCKVDVDKWDYLNRDYHYLRTDCPPINMDFDDIFKNARISRNGEHVEYNTKDFHKIYQLFVARYKMHVHCYNRPLSVACNHLLKLAWESGESYIFVPEDNADWLKTEVLEFTDVNIWAHMQTKQPGRYLSHIDKIEYFTDIKGKGDVFDSEGNLHGFYLDYKVRGPGEEMPADQFFDLYGDPNLKQHFERNCEAVECGGFFRLLPFKDND